MIHTFECISRAWDYRVSTSKFDCFTKFGTPLGSEAVSSCIFVLLAHDLSWWCNLAYYSTLSFSMSSLSVPICSCFKPVQTRCSQLFCLQSLDTDSSQLNLLILPEQENGLNFSTTQFQVPDVAMCAENLCLVRQRFDQYIFHKQAVERVSLRSDFIQVIPKTDALFDSK